MLPSCVTSSRRCVDVGVAWPLPHFATLLSIPARWAFVRTRYVSTPSSMPPPITRSRASVSASPVARVGSSRAFSSIRSRGCFPTVSPTFSALSSAGADVCLAIRGYRQARKPTTRPTVSARTRRTSTGIYGTALFPARETRLVTSRVGHITAIVDLETQDGKRERAHGKSRSSEAHGPLYFPVLDADRSPSRVRRLVNRFAD